MLRNNTLWSRFALFGLVGTAGFIVDVAVLYILINVGIDAYSGRLISFALAVTFTWYCNRRLTFADRGSARWLGEWARFVAANSSGAIVNYAVYAFVLAMTPVLAWWPMVGVAMGSLAGMTFNFTASHVFVFRARG